jgi:glutamine synthetase
VGKRFLAKYFAESAHEETHGCNYPLANDIDMGRCRATRQRVGPGYGDFVMKPDLSTIRRIPWLEKTALVLCDVQDHHSHEDLPHSPRGILKRQVKRLTERGYLAYFASELEFYLFDETYQTARAKHWQNLGTASPYIQDYVIPLTTAEEAVMRKLRNDMEAAGIPI